MKADHVYSNHTFRCTMCGATVQVVDSTTQPHACRVELP